MDDPKVSDPYNSMLSGIRTVFNRAFPRNTSLVDNNIPAILGIFEDNSPSTTYKKAFKPVVDAFKNYYLGYSYASGVVSAVNLSSLSGHINIVSNRSEDWLTSSVQLLEKTLNYDNLISVDALKYVTSGVGQSFAREDSYEFQIPPPSGGRVYIFEKEDTGFNLVQAIKAPEEEIDFSYGLKYNDRFGHSVAISEDAKTITVGSPYSTEDCQIYSRNEEEKVRIFSRSMELNKSLDSRLNLASS
jgi:hypothetical protein